MTSIHAAGVRALRTFLQVLIPALGAGALTELNYLGAASIAAGAALLAFLQGILGSLPEVDEGDVELDADTFDEDASLE